MMAITTNSSTSVKPFRLFIGLLSRQVRLKQFLEKAVLASELALIADGQPLFKKKSVGQL
jgi:hypothetical protein